MRALYPEDADAVVTKWKEVAADAGSFNMQFRFQTPAGEVRWVRGKTMPIRSDDAVTGHVGTIEDITDQKRAKRSVRLYPMLFRASLRQSTWTVCFAWRGCRSANYFMPRIASSPSTIRPPI